MTNLDLIEDTYFKDLPEDVQTTVSEALKDKLDALQSDMAIPELYTDRDPDEIECYSRDGFIAASHNKGGYELLGFTDLMGVWGSGIWPSREDACKEIQRQVDYSFEIIAEEIYERHKALFDQYNLTKEQATYHDTEQYAQEVEEFETVNREIQESEYEFLGDESSSLMYSLRFMYHGCDENGVHTASVSACINAEGPYHRPISGLEFAKEVELAWNDHSLLEGKLETALNIVCKEVF